MKNERHIPIPRPVKRGNRISARTIDKMRESLEILARSREKESYSVAVGVADPPFTIVPGSSNSNYRITPGTVNTVYPTIDGVSIDDAAVPEIEVIDTTYVWIKCVGLFSDDPTVYTFTIETSSDPATPAGTEITDTGFTSYLYLGVINYVDSYFSELNDYSGGNLWVESFGSVNFWWKV